MRKSVFKYSLLFLCPLLITVSYTSAWFSGQAVSNANVMQSGTLILKGPGQIIGESEFKNLFPGWQDAKTVTIENKGTLPMRCKMSVRSDDKSILSNGIYAAAANIEDDRYAGKPTSVSRINDAYIGIIEPGGSKSIQLDFNMPKESGNEYSGLSCNLKFYFDAVQENAPFIFKVEGENKIQDAVNAARAGDIINIGKGNYNENIHIDKSLTLNGDASGESILSFSDGRLGDGVIIVNNNIKNVSINNLTINAGKNSGVDGINLCSNNENINFNNVKFTNGRCSVWVTGQVQNISFNNTDFTDNSTWCVHFNSGMAVSDLYFNGCNFNSKYNIYAVSRNGANIKNMNFTNCKYSGVNSAFK